MRNVFVILVAVLALTGCAQNNQSQIALAVQATLAAGAPAATLTLPPTLIPAATKTSTAYPTSAPTSTSATSTWQIAQVIAAFKAAGLEVESPTTMTTADYGMAPMRAIEGVRYLIPSMGSEKGGRIFRCATAEDLAAMRDFYVSLGKSSAMFFSWTFEKDNILVQINGSLPEEAARKYDAVLQAMQ